MSGSAMRFSSSSVTGMGRSSVTTWSITRRSTRRCDLPGEQLNAEYVTAVQWWAPTELETADVRFAPRRLPLLVRELSMHGAPAEPIDAGV
jgi:hypothetical protein